MQDVPIATVFMRTAGDSGFIIDYIARKIKFFYNLTYFSKMDISLTWMLDIHCRTLVKPCMGPKI